MDDRTVIHPRWRLVCHLATHGGMNKNLSGCDLSEAHLDGADFRGTKFVQTNLSDATLRGADLTGAILDGANFDNADLTGAKVTLKQFKRAATAAGAITPAGRQQSHF